MIPNRDLEIDDYLAMAKRRWRWVLIPIALGPLVGFLISFVLTPKYVSQSLLLVEDQVVPTGYVSPIVTQHVSDRMITLQQNVLSRARLQPVVDRLGLTRTGKNAEAVINKIRGNVSVSPYHKGGEGTADVSGFHINYSADNPRDAQAVCAEITSLLLTENQEVREQVARTTTDFLTRQLEQSKRNLDDMDAKLSEFKIQHFGRLPGDMETSLKILASMTSQLDASTQNVARLQQDKSHTEMILEQELAALKSAQAAPTFPTLRQQLLHLQNQLVMLQTQYTDDFPDVVRTKHEIEHLQAKLKAINAEAEVSDSERDSTIPREGARLEPPEIRALREHIYHSDIAIERALEAQKLLKERMDSFQSRFQLDVGIEEQWKQLTRDNNTAHTIYNQLLTNKSAAEVQTEMERTQEGEQLRLIDPASLPDSPVFPVRSKFATYGLAAGLAIGLCIALWMEVKDKAIRNEADVAAALGLPMLGTVPWTGVVIDGKNWSDKLRGPFARQLPGKETL